MAFRNTLMMAGLAFAMLSEAAHASVLEFKYIPDIVAKGVAINASGHIDVEHAVGIIYRIVNAGGEVNGSQITGIDNNSAPALFADSMGNLSGNNNVAVRFSTVSGVEYNFGFGIASSSSGDINFGRFEVSSVPLPGSAPVFGLALLSLAGLSYAARYKKAATTSA